MPCLRCGVFAQAEISAIPETAQPNEEHEMIQFAIAGVERLAGSLQMLEPVTKAGSRMMARAKAWLNGGDLACLLEPLELAA
jgi:hypothetical protein